MSISYLFENSNYSNIDGSFNSKFYIISQAFEFYTTQSLMTHMFGVGLGNTEQLLGIFAHNIYVTLVLEFGFIGSFLFITFIFIALKRQILIHCIFGCQYVSVVFRYLVHIHHFYLY